MSVPLKYDAGPLLALFIVCSSSCGGGDVAAA